MFTHIMVGANDPDVSIAFYDAVLGALDIQGHRMGDRAFYRNAGGAFGVGKPRDGEAATPANGGTIGFQATSAAQVDAFHAARAARMAGHATARRACVKTRLVNRMAHIYAIQRAIKSASLPQADNWGE